MAADLTKNNPEIEALFRKYESAPDSYVFAPLADAYRKAGLLEEAVEICRKGLRKHPKYPSGHVVEGKCHFDVGKLDEAEASFKKVLELDENNLVALKYLGMIQAGRGRLDEAGRYFRNILELDPENREIKGMLDDIREVEQPSGTRQKSDLGGDDNFEGAPIYLGGDGEMADDLATTTLADIYAAQGFDQKAARIYREVLRNQPGNEEVRRKLSALEGKDDDDEPAAAEEAPRAAAVEPAERVEQIEPPKRPQVVPAGDEREDVALQATVEDPVAEPASPPEPELGPGEAVRVGDGETPSQGQKAGRTLDEQKSYDQFKRWLENMKK
jgi:tetratricopeptide (TPR) repeat protein